MPVLAKNKKTTIKQTLPYASVIVVYRAGKTTWRGFVLPYDITFEAPTKQRLLKILRSMRSAYVDGLKEYGSPAHLTDVPLSYDEDRRKWEEISADLVNRLLNSQEVIATDSYYAEAQLPVAALR